MGTARTIHRVPIPQSFEPDSTHGFLPRDEPLDRLPRTFAIWDEIGSALPKLLISDAIRETLSKMPILDAVGLETDAQLERAMMLLSYFGHAYVWGAGDPAKRLPASIAAPWHAVAKRLGRPPVLSYASYALNNWRRIDRDGSIALGNIALLQNFLGGADEEWFILVHVDIEAKAASGLARILLAQEAAAGDRAQELTDHLEVIRDALSEMNRTMARMPERCDPYIYYNRVRPYLYGWKDQPALPEGLVYEGVDEYAGRPQKFRGETGAQSGIVPCLDAALGIGHRDDPLRVYLAEMRQYMPPVHRGFLERIEARPSIRKHVLERAARQPALRDVYNACVAGIEKFRGTHYEYAAAYIHKQSRKAAANPTDVGTGGTPFMAYLKKHREETGRHALSGENQPRSHPE
jgi:indoleamine 2,3-dioxygenase